MFSLSEKEYNEHLRTLREFITYPQALDYVKVSLLDPYKDKFVAAWTDTCMHFGNVTLNQ